MCFHKAVANTYRTFLHSLHKLLLLLEGLLKLFFFWTPYYHIISSFSPLQPAITSSLPSPFKVFQFLKLDSFVKFYNWHRAAQTIIIIYYCFYSCFHFNFSWLVLLMETILIQSFSSSCAVKTYLQY